MLIQEAPIRARLTNVVIQPDFIQMIIDVQKDDAKLMKISDEVAKGLRPDFIIHVDGGLYF